MTEIQSLAEKLKRIEALFAGTTYEGEKDAAGEALERIKKKIKELEKKEKPLEYKFSMTNYYTKQLFTALLRRYNYEPYRYPGQRYTTVMVKIQKTFLDEILWPEFKELEKILMEYLAEVTNKVISENICKDTSDAGEVSEKSLEMRG